MSLVWVELLELLKGRSGVALTQFSSSSKDLKTYLAHWLAPRMEFISQTFTTLYWTLLYATLTGQYTHNWFCG
jgi:hypothetical protein